MNKLKELIEKRNSLASEMNDMVNKAAEEVRAMTEDEDKQFAELESEIRALDSTIEKAKAEVALVAAEVDTEERSLEDAEIEKREIADFASFIRSKVKGEIREDNLTMGDNGAVVPHTIANMIVKKLVDIAPLYAQATKFNTKGTLSIPYYDESTTSITVGFADEFTDLESSAAGFGSIDLTGYLAGALCRMSRSLINNSDFDLVSFVVADMAEKMAIFIEGCILGNAKVDGLKKGVKQSIQASADVTADDLITIQDTVKDALQGNAIWVMGRASRTKIRQLKDNENRYMLNNDITGPFGYTLLGKPVYVTDAITDDTIYYGDFSGVAVKEVESPEIQVLFEHYATSHTVGVLAWIEIDAKVFDTQKIVAWGKGVTPLLASEPLKVTTKTTK